MAGSWQISASSRQIIAARWLVPVSEEAGAQRPLWLENYALVLRGDRIEAVLPQEEAWQNYPEALRIMLPEHALLPGLVNAHTHAAMSLLRGLGDDQALHDWLGSVIWPVEQALVDEQFVRDGSYLAVAEMLRGGCTLFNDMYWYPEETARVCQETGIRAMLGLVMADFPSRYGAGAPVYFQKATELARQLDQTPAYRTADDNAGIPLLFCAYAPHAPYSVSDHILQEVGERAQNEKRRVHIHLHETAAEVEASQALDRQHFVCHRSAFAGTPLDNLERLGLLAANWTLVHMVHVTDEHLQLVRKRGASIVHCPWSNLKLGSGICPLNRMLEAGINVALGTDGAASNNRLDMWSEMRLAASLAKGTTGRSDAFRAYQAIRMATIQGARALGLDHLLGSLEVGKAADVVAVRLGDWLSTMPVHDLFSALVYAAGPDQVTDVWIGGRRVLHDGTLTTISQAALVERVQYWRARIMQCQQTESDDK
jgi:5-methylthioadenosine/S-adenosylhomocysteine deaminase